MSNSYEQWRALRNRELAIQLCGLTVMIVSGWLLYKALWGKMPHDPPLWLVAQAVICGILLFGTGLCSWLHHILEEHPDRLKLAVKYGYGSMALLWLGGLVLSPLIGWHPLWVAMFLTMISTAAAFCLTVYGWIRRWLR